MLVCSLHKKKNAKEGTKSCFLLSLTWRVEEDLETTTNPRWLAHGGGIPRTRRCDRPAHGAKRVGASENQDPGLSQRVGGAAERHMRAATEVKAVAASLPFRRALGIAIILAGRKRERGRANPRLADGAFGGFVPVSSPVCSPAGVASRCGGRAGASSRLPVSQTPASPP